MQSEEVFPAAHRNELLPYRRLSLDTNFTAVKLVELPMKPEGPCRTKSS